MENLIKKLWYNDGVELTSQDFTEAIKIACEAQRKAILRAYNNYKGQDNFIPGITIAIECAQIKEEDYE